MLGNMSIFELVMLICFGFAWPTNIYKSYRTRSARGKSLSFLLIIEVGYISGIINKLLYHRDIVMAAYILNFTLVLIDVLLYFRNRRLDRLRDQGTAV